MTDASTSTDANVEHRSSEVEQELATAHLRIRELQDHVATSESHIREHEQNVRKLDGDMKGVQVRAQLIDSENNALRTEKTQLQDRIGDLTKERDQQAGDAVAAQQARRTLEQTCTDLRDRISGLESQALDSQGWETRYGESQTKV
ncbi:hypothetical protein, partial [Staphylococcus aureus]|uniref:hypothetical protein n=1 Tax=Staphylococcus aureus TaxID=1280 RepID=UPI0020211C16